MADCCSGAPKKIIWNRFLHALNPNSETTHFLYSYRRDQATLKSPIFTQNRDFSAATSSYYYSITNLSKRDHNCDTTQKARNFKCEKKSKYGFCYIRGVHLHSDFEMSSSKNLVGGPGFFVYFELDFYCLCSLQKSSSK